MLSLNRTTVTRRPLTQAMDKIIINISDVECASHLEPLLEIASIDSKGASYVKPGNRGHCCRPTHLEVDQSALGPTREAR